MNFQSYTLGCKVNQYETQAMEQLLTALGHRRGEEDCQIFIINTCTVTAVADRKNRTLIHRIRREHPNAVIGVCGCYAQLNPAQVEQMGVDVVGGSAQREEFVQLLLQAAREKGQRIAVDEALKRRSFELLPAGGLSTRTRAMLKVQDGCNNFCSYCIIPYARGPVRSAPLEEVLAQGRQLAQEGYREIVVTGIEIASWGWDRKEDGKSLTDLIEALCAALPQVRVRLGSLEPRIIDEEFCRRLSPFSNLCPQFHLSLQSGSAGVLQRMRRKYDPRRYYESVSLLRQYFPGCGITTDLIVGFPGETEEELEESLEFCKKCAFSAIHVFPYSRRPGTPADRMEGQVEKQEKSRRAAKAGQVAKQLQQAFLRDMEHSLQEVLFEQPEGEYFTGHGKNGVKVYVKGSGLHNQSRTVRILAPKKEGVEGVLL